MPPVELDEVITVIRGRELPPIKHGIRMSPVILPIATKTSLLDRMRRSMSLAAPVAMRQALRSASTTLLCFLLQCRPLKPFHPQDPGVIETSNARPHQGEW